MWTGIFKKKWIYNLLIYISVPMLWSPTLEARVFSFEQESFAPFLNLRGGMSSMGYAPYDWQQVQGHGGGKADFIYGGEFGARWRSPHFAFSLGVLVQRLDAVRGVQGFDGFGASLFAAEAEALAFGPTAQLDIQLAQATTHQWKLFFGGGYQFAKHQTRYQLTSLGQSTWGLPGEVQETYKATIPHATFGIGAEFLMAKTTTMSLQLGYHHSISSAWTHGQNGTNMAGTYTEGAPVIFEDGTTKPINWSYAFLQIGFQFYVQTLR
jgi:hypothetical protein